MKRQQEALRNHIDTLLAERHMTRKRLAEVAGVSIQHVYGFFSEKNPRMWSWEVIRKVGLALNEPVSHLYKLGGMDGEIDNDASMLAQTVTQLLQQMPPSRRQFAVQLLRAFVAIPEGEEPLVTEDKDKKQQEVVYRPKRRAAGAVRNKRKYVGRK